jgi:MOSC domain-containing protein YiiM
MATIRRPRLWQGLASQSMLQAGGSSRMGKREVADEVVSEENRHHTSCVRLSRKGCQTDMSQPVVRSVHVGPRHEFSKREVNEMRLVAGIGVEGDAHAGSTVQHRSRVKVDPTQPNLRQVHLIHEELFGELAAEGFHVPAGGLGENITTSGIDLLGLPVGATLRIGAEALLAVTGLRNPCSQIEDFQAGLLSRVAMRQNGRVVRKSGIMAVVVQGGIVRAGDPISISLPPRPHASLDRV